MENLFRLVLTRPAVTQSEETPSIPLSQNTAFQAGLGQAQQQENKRSAMKAIARAYIAGTLFTGDPAAMPLRPKVKALAAALDELEEKDVLTNTETAKAIETAFEKKAADIVKDKILEAPVESLKDSIIAIKLLPGE